MRKMKRRSWTWLGAGLLAGVLGGCSDSTAPPEGPAAQTQSAAHHAAPGAQADPRPAFASAPEAALATLFAAPFDLKPPDVDQAATLQALADAQRRTLHDLNGDSVDECTYFTGQYVAADGSPRSLDDNRGNRAWALVEQGKDRQWRSLGAGFGWPPRSTETRQRGYKDVHSGASLGLNHAEWSLWRYDGLAYRPHTSMLVTNALLDLQRLAVTDDLARAALAEYRIRNDEALSDVVGMALRGKIRLGDEIVTLVDLRSAKIGQRTIDLVNTGRVGSKLYLFAMRSGRWVRLARAINLGVLGDVWFRGEDGAYVISTQVGGTAEKPEFYDWAHRCEMDDAEGVLIGRGPPGWLPPPPPGTAPLPPATQTDDGPALETRPAGLGD